MRETTRILDDRLLLALICVIGLFLRVLHLNAFGFSVDEALSVSFSTAKLKAIATSNQAHNNPPLYFLLLSGWLSIFPKSEAALRSLSVVIGALCIPSIYLLGKLLWDRRTGLIAASLMAVMVFPIFYSQILRNYSLFLLLSIVCFYQFIRFLESTSRWHLVAYILSSVALVYTHFYSIFLLIAQNFCVLLFYRRKRTLVLWCLTQAVILFCTIPWLIALFHKSSKLLEEGFWIPLPQWKDLANAFRTHFVFLVFPYFVWVYLLFVIYALLEPLLPATRDQNERRKIFLLFLWGMSSFIPPFLLSFFTTPFFVSRYTIGSLPALYLLCSRGIERFPFKRLKIGGAILIFISVVWSLHRYYHYSVLGANPWQESYSLLSRSNWREFITEIKQRTNHRDLIAVDWGHKTLFRFYAPDLAVQTLPVVNSNGTDMEAFLKTHRRKARVWLIIGYPITLDQKLLLTVMGKRYKELDHNLSVQPTNYSSVHLYSLRPRDRLDGTLGAAQDSKIDERK